LDYVKFTGIDDYFYVKKGNNTFTLESSYNNELIQLDNNIFNLLTPLHNKLMEQHLEKIPDYLEHSEYYLVNTKTEECICFNYMWNGLFRDVCKYYHAASIYKESIGYSDLLFFEQEVKKELVQYFKNKERVLPAESKNLLLYNGDIETAYLEITILYDTYGNNYFKRI
jgi:hypothetical protein